MQPGDPLPLSRDEISTLFIDQPDPQPHTYELALVLGGTVSAGSYTAGALDFLFEALDEWTQRRDAVLPGGAEPDVPTHRVQIRVIAGTSGGGVNAAIAARALAYAYPPISRGATVSQASPPAPTGNPFYDVWCGMLRLDGFLGLGDLAGQSAPQSILNPKPIDDAAAHIASFTAEPLQRSYLGEPARGEPMRVVLTLTNLHGIPYRTVFTGPDAGVTMGETFVDHADHVRFAVAYPGQVAFAPRPDETVLSFGDTRMPRAASWDEFSRFARATAAFPIGFPARTLNRETLDYRYRVAALPADAAGSIEVRGLTPDWAQLRSGGMLPGAYSFVAVDGGATDNEPIALARAALCGVTTRNPRDARTANRGVLLIDPFSGEAGLTPPPGSIFEVATGSLQALLQQTRYATADLVLAADPAVFSRFMISANRDGQIGSKAVATGGVGAFIGFACPAFMRHDYLLGRANCQKMLMQSFVVHPENPVVAGRWSEEQAATNGVEVEGVRYRRLIPLYGNAAVPETTDPWPVGALAPDAFRDGIEARWKALLERVSGDTWWARLAAWLAAELTEGGVADYAAAKIRADLLDWKLLPPGASP